jgi:nucleoside-diphosphate-sugar epimerase
MIRNKRILVTGGSGFIGTRLCSTLLDRGNDVVVFNRRKNKNTEKLLERGASFVQGSVTDTKSVKGAIQDVQLVFHLASTSSPEATEEDYQNSNVLGTKNVFDAACDHQVERLVYCTTGGVLGSIKRPPGNENTPYNPVNIYQQTNMVMEELGKRYHREKGLPLVTIRSCGIYGPGDRKHLQVFKIIQRGIFPVIQQNKRKRDMVYVDDFVRALLLAAEEKKAVGRLYHATHEWVTIESMAKAIAGIMGIRPLYIRIPTKPLVFSTAVIEKASKVLGISPPLFRRRIDFFLEQRYLDSTKIRTELGFSPKTDCIAGLEKTYNWYRSEGWL